MGITSAIVLFLVIWFLVLLIILPIRLETQGDVGTIEKGTHAGSPVKPNMKKRFLITTAVSAVLWGIIAGAILSGTFNVRDLDFFNRMPVTDETNA